MADNKNKGTTGGSNQAGKPGSTGGGTTTTTKPGSTTGTGTQNEGGSEGGSPERGAKSRAIREMITNNPGMKNKDIADKLTADGIKCTPQDVANQKSKLTNKGSSGVMTGPGLLELKQLVKEGGGLPSVRASVDRVIAMADKCGGISQLADGLKTLEDLTA